MNFDLNEPIGDIELNIYPLEHDPPPNSPPLLPLPQAGHSSQPAHFDLNQLPQDFDLNQLPLDDFPTNTTTEETIPQPHANKKKNLTTMQKQKIIQMLVQESRDGILPNGVVPKVADHFSISTRSVSRIWHDTKISIANGSVVDTSSNMVKRVGRKRIELDLGVIKTIPFRRRTNIRSLANALGLAKSTVHDRVKEGSIRAHSNAVKPFLTDDNKKRRLEFCLSMIDKGTIGTNTCFINMYDRIHIDEKWFYMSKTSQKYYLHPEEIEPLRTCKSKRFIPKIMFLGVVARPRYANSNREFNGKIGIWPFVYTEPAKRQSKNRVAGTMETKPITSVTKDVIRSCLIKNVLPAIKEKWPSDDNNTIYIQQDNARTHIDANDAEFVDAVGRLGLNVRLCCQPPNSPDLNVLDLGFFRAIESLQHQEAPSTADELISSVKNAFNMFPSEDLNNVFLTLQSCMVEIMKNFGGNVYKIPHMNKKKLIREEQLALCIEVDPHVLNEAEEAVSERQDLEE